MNATTHTGDLDIARIVLADDDFIDGHRGLDAEQYFGEAPATEPGTVGVQINGEVVESLLIARGWKRGDNGAWYAPDGDSMHWDRAEALTLALTAEVFWVRLAQ
jgi:hypothetical protein